jgi:hypothetical protein
MNSLPAPDGENLAVELRGLETMGYLRLEESEGDVLVMPTARLQGQAVRGFVCVFCVELLLLLNSFIRLCADGDDCASDRRRRSQLLCFLRHGAQSH